MPRAGLKTHIWVLLSITVVFCDDNSSTESSVKNTFRALLLSSSYVFYSINNCSLVRTMRVFFSLRLEISISPSVWFPWMATTIANQSHAIVRQYQASFDNVRQRLRRLGSIVITATENLHNRF